MADRATVERRLADWFLQSLNLEIPSPETDLFDTGVLDSLAFVELLLHLEREFGVTITLEHVELANFGSVARIAAFLVNGSGATQLDETPGKELTP
ncbi:MAG: acyl carrier protein [Candidatus Rokubacteria bacterium]|nr:acyl carrier protein [Candidatus Rokubacteria bacterium]